MKFFRTSIFVLFAALLSIAHSASAEGTGPTILTVTGNVTSPNRGAFNEATDKFFAFHEVEFSDARAFSAADLAALPQATVRADFPKGDRSHTFTGPLLIDVLDAAGATGQAVTVQALDGYAVEVPFDQLMADEAVVALTRDGAPMGIGDFGPTQIVFPRGDRDDLADMPDDNWVWSIFHIRVE